jgi:hypothetical protein
MEESHKINTKICKHHGELTIDNIVHCGDRLRCKLCNSRNRNKWYVKNKEYHNNYTKEYYQKNKETILKRTRDRRAGKS